MNNISKWILITLIGLLHFPSVYAVSQITGQKLLESCQDAQAIFEQRTQDLSMQAAANSALCLGYVTGFEDMHYIASAIAAGVPKHYDVAKNALYYCIADDVPLSDQVKQVVDYLKRNPEALNKSAAVVLFTIFKNHYPCKKTQKQ